MLLTNIKKTDLWFLPLFLILFAFICALFSTIKMKETDRSVSIIVRAKIEHDDTLQFSFSTPDFSFSNNNTKKISVTGSPASQNIVCTLPDFIQVNKVKLIFGSNINKHPIDIQKISIQKNNFNYSFCKNDIVKLFPIRKGFLLDSINGEYRYNKEEGVFKPYFQSRNIYSLYESVRLSNNQTTNISIFIAFFIAFLTTSVIYFIKNNVKAKLHKYNFKFAITIFKNKIELSRPYLMCVLLVLFVLYVFIIGNYKNDSFSVMKNDIALNVAYDTINYEIYNSIPLIPSNNLIYNGNFEHGLKFWTSDTDTTNLSIIDTPFGKGVRITVDDAFGQNWFLKYKGRPIVYYPGHKYQIKFKYRIIKGGNNLFKFGWFFNNKPRFFDPTDLKLKLSHLPNNWFEAKAEILFSKGIYNLAFGVHSIENSTTIEVCDIQLIDLYETNVPYPFLDQIENNGKKVEQVFTDLNNCPKEVNNLIVNGDFRSGLMNWSAYADSTDFDWIETPFGKGVRVTRTDGDGGYWSLFYIGPKINFQTKKTYEINFKFKIIKGSEKPFKVGWWVKDNGKDYSPANLALELNKLDNGWYSAKTQYTFISSYTGLPMLFNSFKDFSIVEFADISMKIDSIAN